MSDTDSTVSTAADLPLPQQGWAPLEDRVVVRISGSGADKFLQGQFSQNLDEVTLDRAPRAAAATPKGRAYCLTRMVRSGDDVLMDLPADLASEDTRHLQKYLMLFRGTTMETAVDMRIVGILGDRLARSLAAEGIDALKVPGDAITLTDGILIRTEPTAEGCPRFEFWQTSSDVTTLESETRIPLVDWRASEIAAGVAALTPATRESFVPQMLNWQHVGGVHFKKGCYTGQEVIARMHFLGQLKKSLFRFGADRAEPLPAPGSALCTYERAVGEVVNSVAYQDGSCELLAVVRHDSADAPLHPEGQPEAILSPLPLPYSVPEREKTAQSDT